MRDGPGQIEKEWILSVFLYETDRQVRPNISKVLSFEISDPFSTGFKKHRATLTLLVLILVLEIASIVIYDQPIVESMGSRPGNPLHFTDVPLSIDRGRIPCLLQPHPDRRVLGGNHAIGRPPVGFCPLSQTVRVTGSQQGTPLR